MVKKILSFIGKEISGLHEAAYLLAIFAFLSQILALIRDRLLAHNFGASHELDLYYAAFRIPDFLFALIGSMVSISVLVPFLAERFEKGPEEAKAFIDNVFSLFCAVMGGVALACIVLAPWIVPHVLPGFAGSPDLPQLILMTRIMLLSPLFLGFSNFFSSITQIYSRFLIYAISPLLYNIGIIVGAAFLYPIIGVTGLALGVAGGALMHWLVQVPFVKEKSMLPKLKRRIDWQSVKKVVLLSFPRTLTLSANELAELSLVAGATLMTSGAVSIFNFSWNLQSVPLSIVGVSYTSAAFPILSKLLAAGKKSEFLEKMVVSTQHIIFWSTPIMALFIVLRAQIVRVILGSGMFNWADTRLTAACLAVFALSLIPQSLIVLFVRAYYSTGRTRKPMIVNVISSLLILALGYLLVLAFNGSPTFAYFIESLFKVDGLAGTAVLMLPLAYTIGVFVNTIIHWVMFEGEFPGYSRAVFRTFFQSISASIIMGYVAYYMLNVFDDVFGLHTVLGVFLQGFCAGIMGIAAGVLVLVALRNKEIALVWRTLHHKIWKAKVLLPEQERM